MNLINVEQVSKTQGNKKLFENISFGINEGDKIALIGLNGCGKSTLLKILCDVEGPDSGVVSRNRALKMSILSQVPVFDSEDTILGHILKGESPKLTLIKKYEDCTEKIKNKPNDPVLQKELENLSHLMDTEDAWQFEREIRAILDQFGLTDLNRKMSELSGGMLKKVALAQCLVSDNNLLILDEPTNHLDIETIGWLENYLSKNIKTLIMVTHDRYFLDRVCNHIIEIDREQIYQFNGNYSYYIEKKTELENNLQAEQDRIRSVLRNELVWLKRGPKARGTKQKARIDRISDLQSRKVTDQTESLDISVIGRRLGNKILDLEGVSKSFNGNLVIKDFTYAFKKGEKIGIIGPNGVGKSTLLNLITGKLQPDSGKIDAGINTHFGFFDQNAVQLNPNQRVIDFIRSTSEHITLANGEVISAGKMLERFLFTAKQQSSYIENLSGGERRRLYLLHILMKNPNFLLFDEPTNDLDIQTLCVLEDFLDNFGGCVILVSHDRYFMDRLAGMLLVFEGGGEISLFAGNYTEYLDSMQEKESIKQQKPKADSKKPEPEKKQEKKKLSYNEKREFSGIEKEIEQMEKEKAEIEQKFNLGKWDDVLTKRHKELEELILKKMERWEYLSGFTD